MSATSDNLKNPEKISPQPDGKEPSSPMEGSTSTSEMEGSSVPETDAASGPETGGPSTSDIPDTASEVRVDALSKDEANKEYVENRPQRLASDLLEQKYKLQGNIFSIAIVIICVFYFVFLIMVVRIACSPQHDLFKLPATVTVLIGMLGSIPTILTAFLMTGLFRDKDGKDKEKEDKSAIDLGILAKVIFEVAKATKKP